MKSGIYTIHSAVNGRSYVGSAVYINQRWAGHRLHLRRGSHPNPHLQNAWNKYGEVAFEFIVLEECPVELLIEREQHYIDQCDNCYNIAKVAGSRLGTTASPETKARMSAASTGRTLSPEARGKIADAQRGKKRSNETKARISAGLTGREFSDEHRANLSAARTGTRHSPETRAKMSASMKARWSRKQSGD